MAGLVTDIKKLIILLLFCGTASLVISIHLSNYNQNFILESVRAKYYQKQHQIPFLHVHSNDQEHDPDTPHLDTPFEKPPPPPPPPPSSEEEFSEKVGRISELSVDDHIVIFPNNFKDLRKGQSITDYYKKNFNSSYQPITKDSSGHDQHHHLVQILAVQPESDFQQRQDFHPHSFNLYQSSPLTNDKQFCKANLANVFEVEISQSHSHTLKSLVPALLKFRQENSPYYQEIEPFWQGEFEEQYKKQQLDNHWYRLAGSSVWLAEYGVHFMISRVLYTPTAVRNSPAFSLTYAQIFNDQWQEMHNVELIFPSNNPDVGNQLASGDSVYSSMSYPRFLPIPAYHNRQRRKGRFYGPEDPRIILVKNPKGHEEPLLVFNAYQRKIVKDEKIPNTNDLKMNITFGYYRSMFVCWPWQFQRGKYNVDDLNLNENYNHQLYNRVAELKRENVPRIRTQKNWTPFLSFDEREQLGYDESIYFTYRWRNLEVMKCDLSNIVNGVSNCKFDYRLDPSRDSNEKVGPLRGGTQLVNINRLLHVNSKHVPELKALLKSFPRGREVWVGFARAHLRSCGCGLAFYRPNLVVITLDRNPKGEHFFKLSHVSSFISFDVPLIPWDPNQPKQLCLEGQPNVLIPNGISDWTFKPVVVPDGGDGGKTGDKNSNDQIRAVQDYLTLSLSVGDATVDSITIKGLLNELFRLDHNTDLAVNKLFSKDSNEIKDDVHYDWLRANGYNNNNVLCALKESGEYCEEYGLAHGEKTKEEKERDKQQREKEENAKKQKENKQKVEEGKNKFGKDRYDNKG